MRNRRTRDHVCENVDEGVVHEERMPSDMDHVAPGVFTEDVGRSTG